ncbi:MAG: phosphate ABC transporter substrate-binding protein PstS [Myxococcales bacterium]|nr:phosphate ABC transporter substrate-binding protein PstS [Myxococcales bacterium]
MPRSLPLAALLALAAAACKREGAAPSEDRPARPAVSLQGAGATFPYPLYSKWIFEYGKQRPEIRVNYQSIGSGGGIRQLIERTVDFGATDAPMTDQELAKASGRIVHLPTTLGAVAVTYQVRGLEASSLQFSPEALAGVFLGEIARWDDPELAELNPGVPLPAEPITVIHRSDGSGTTAIFTGYLAKVSPGWNEKVGAGKSVRFPSGLGAKGNEGVTGQIKSTPGSIGYVELAYARQNKLPVAAVRNRAGRPALPTLEAVSAAAAAFTGSLPEDLRLSIVDPPAESAYPISSFSYVLVYEQQPDPVKGQALVDFLWWAIHEGQAMAPQLDYAPLPEAVVRKVEEKLRSISPSKRPSPLQGEGSWP